ncbi:MAG TPA: hypothetical protein VGJ93_10535 [Desulfuromonadaceae bacterium]
MLCLIADSSGFWSLLKEFCGAGTGAGTGSGNDAGAGLGIGAGDAIGINVGFGTDAGAGFNAGAGAGLGDGLGAAGCFGDSTGAAEVSFLGTIFFAVCTTSSAAGSSWSVSSSNPDSNSSGTVFSLGGGDDVRASAFSAGSLPIEAASADLIDEPLSPEIKNGVNQTTFCSLVPVDDDLKTDWDRKTASAVCKVTDPRSETQRSISPAGFWATCKGVPTRIG